MTILDQRAFFKARTLTLTTVITAAAIAACVAAPEPEERRTTRQKITGRWQPARADGENGRGTPDDLGGEGCAGGLKPGTRALGEQLRARFGLASYGGYNCRANTANPSELSIHAVGRALDVSARGSVGDELADHLVANAASLGVQRIIWNRTIWQVAASGPTSRQYSGPNPHTDHVHVEVTRTAAENGGGGAGVSSGATSGDADGGWGMCGDDVANCGSKGDVGSNGDSHDPYGSGGDPGASGGWDDHSTAHRGDNKSGWGEDEFECRTSTDCDPGGAMACKQGFCFLVCTQKLWEQGICD
jgi:hypothetical protein